MSDHLAAEHHEQRRDKCAEKKPDRIQPKKDGSDRKPRQQRVREPVGEQGVPPENDEPAQVAVGEADEQAAEQGFLHELVMEGLEKKAHAKTGLSGAVE